MCTILDDAQPFFAPPPLYSCLSLLLFFLLLCFLCASLHRCASLLHVSLASTRLDSSSGVDRGCATKAPFHHEATYKQVTTICWGVHGGSKACISASLQGWTRSVLHLRQLASVERNHHNRASRLSDWILGPVHVSAGVGRVLFLRGG